MFQHQADFAGQTTQTDAHIPYRRSCRSYQVDNGNALRSVPSVVRLSGHDRPGRRHTSIWID